MKKRGVFFDLDGTLVDTAPDFIAVIEQMCAEKNRPCPPKDAIRAQVSAGAGAMVRLLFAQQPPPSQSDLLAYRLEFLRRYQDNICRYSRLFDGLEDLLAALEARGVAWGVVTNKPRDLSRLLLKKLGLLDRCAALVCPEDVKNPKPDPEGLLLACQKTQLAPADCLYIGDHIRDIQAAKQANVPSAIAAFGYIPPEDGDLAAWGADAIAYDPRQLAARVLQIVDG